MKIPSSTPYIVYAQISELVYSSLGSLVLPTKETVPELCVYRKYLVYCVLKHLESPAFSNDLTSKDEVLPLYVNISFTSCRRGRLRVYIIFMACLYSCLYYVYVPMFICSETIMMFHKQRLLSDNTITISASFVYQNKIYSQNVPRCSL